MALATLAQLKGLLGIDSGDTSRDVALQLALDSAEESILAVTGYSLTALTGRVDIFENKRVGSPIQLSKRPVSGTFVVEGRVMGAFDSDFNGLAASLPDVNKGRMTLLGLQDLSTFYYPGAFPPRPDPTGYFKWRGFTWAVVRVTYDVLALTSIPKAFTQACLQIAATIDELASAGTSGPVTSLTVGNVTETKGSRRTDEFFSAMPPGARGLLAPYFLPNRQAELVF